MDYDTIVKMERELRKTLKEVMESQKVMENVLKNKNISLQAEIQLFQQFCALFFF